MDKFSKLEQRHLLLSKQMVAADGGNMFLVDLYAFGSIKRSMAHCKGFATMIATKNLTCAGGIIRMQLDTLLRFYALFLVDEPHGFAGSVMKGKPVKEHKDRMGQLMHDSYLVKQLSKEYSWVESVYKETSGYIHFSAKHIFSAMHSIGDDRTFQIQISSEDIERSEEVYDEAIAAFVHITEIFLDYLEGWVFTKDNPHLVKAAREQQPA